MSIGCTPPRSAWAIRASSGPVGATGSGSSSWGMEAVLPLPTVMDAMIRATLPSRMADDISPCFSSIPTSSSVRPAMLRARARSWRASFPVRTGEVPAREDCPSGMALRDDVTGGHTRCPGHRLSESTSLCHLGDGQRSPPPQVARARPERPTAVPRHRTPAPWRAEKAAAQPSLRAQEASCVRAIGRTALTSPGDPPRPARAGAADMEPPRGHRHRGRPRG